MAICEDDIVRLARLAEIELSEEDRSRARADLEGIIAMIDAMRTIDTDGVAPLAHPLDRSQRLRPDRVTEVVDRDRYQALAPAVADGLYLVPRVIE